MLDCRAFWDDYTSLLVTPPVKRQGAVLFVSKNGIALITPLERWNVKCTPFQLQ